MMTITGMKRAARWSPLLVLALAACGPSQETQQQIADLQAQVAQKDSLVQEVAGNAKMMSEIGAQLAQVQGAAIASGAESAGMVTRESIISSIHAVGARLDSTRERLATSERRIRRLSGDNATLKRSLADLEATITNQKQTMDELGRQLELARQQNEHLAAANAALGDTITQIVSRQNKVYYVVGTRDELLQKGLIRKEGGHRVLFVFGKAGQVLVPARQLDPSDFTAIDRRQTTEIPLPDPDARYRIVSRNDLSALETQPDTEGYLTGQIRIADPQKFWASSPMLIIVRAS